MPFDAVGRGSSQGPFDSHCKCKFVREVLGVIWRAVISVGKLACCEGCPLWYLILRALVAVDYTLMWL